MLKLLAVAIVSVLAFSGCASINRIDSEVSTYSQWPAARQPSTYAFERLPSQQADAALQQRLEDAARPALEAAGFVAAVSPAQPDVTVQLGLRITPTVAAPFIDDPFWWGGYRNRWGYGWRGGPIWAGGWGPAPFWGGGWRYGGGPFGGPTNVEREVALLIRDRNTGQALYEAHATSESLSPQFDNALPAMFEAALKDFPGGDAKPHPISIEVGK